MHSLVYFLPSGNRTMLQYLLSFLGNLLKNGDKNGIAIDSLAIIFGPCLLRSRPEDPDREVALGVSILREMIEYYERLFVEFKDMTWRVSTDGISQLAVARVEQIVETAIDPNYLGRTLVSLEVKWSPVVTRVYNADAGLTPHNDFFHAYRGAIRRHFVPHTRLLHHVDAAAEPLHRPLRAKQGQGGVHGRHPTQVPPLCHAMIRWADWVGH
jgi:hypothetical protein